MDRPNLTVVIETARSYGVCGGFLAGRAHAFCGSSACRQEAHRTRRAGRRSQRANTAAVNNQARAVQHQARKICQVAAAHRHELPTARKQLASTRQPLLLR